MNRKQFLILVIALVVLGGAGLALFWQDIAAYRSTGAKIGAPLLKNVKVADVASVHFKDATHEATLARKDNHWVVQERGDYPANFQELSDVLIKLAELKVVQSETVGESLLPRVGLATPGKAPAAEKKDESKDASKDDAGIGTLVEIRDASGTMLASLVVGKVVKKKDPVNPLPNAVNGVPAGRYILIAGSQNVAVVNDPLEKINAAPGHWLDPAFFKADRIKTLTVADEKGTRWKITRDEEWGQWKFAGGGGELDPSAAVEATNALGNLSFKDVAVKPEAEAAEKPVTVTADTFDHVAYVFRIAQRKDGDYLLSGKIEGEPLAQRTPEKDEKPQDKARRDKEYAEQLKTLNARLARERMLEKWTYVVDAKTLEPVLKDRAAMVAQKKKEK
jgi:hypothetical protein